MRQLLGDLAVSMSIMSSRIGACEQQPYRAANYKEPAHRFDREMRHTACGVDYYQKKKYRPRYSSACRQSQRLSCMYL